MPSRLRLDHSISGPDLDALMAGQSATRRPAWGPLAGLNAYGPVTRLWPVLAVAGVLLLLVGLAGRGIANAPRTDMDAASPVVITAPATPVIDYATAPTMGVWCDGTRYEMETAREVDALRRAVPDWPRRCWADYGWCDACQVAWYTAHP